MRHVADKRTGGALRQANQEKSLSFDFSTLGEAEAPYHLMSSRLAHQDMYHRGSVVSEHDCHLDRECLA